MFLSNTKPSSVVLRIPHPSMFLTIFELILGQEWNSNELGDCMMKSENIFDNSSINITLVHKDHPEDENKQVFQIFSSNIVDQKYLSVVRGEKHCHGENAVTENESNEKDKKQLWRRHKSYNNFFFTNLQSKKVLTLLPNNTFITLCQSQFVSKNVIQKKIRKSLNSNLPL